MRISSGAASGLVMAFVAAVGLSAYAQDQPPFQLEADSVEYNYKDGSSVYQGNVVISRDAMRLTGNLVEIHMRGDVPGRIISKGNPAGFRDRLDDRQIITVTARIIDYDNENRVMRLRGDATVDYDGKVLRGENITYDLDKKQIKARKGRKRVRFTIKPDRIKSSEN